GRAVKMAVGKRQPEGRNASSVESLPKKFRRHVLALLHAAKEPERIESGEFQQLRHLGVMAKSIEQPSDLHIDAEFVARVAFCVEELANERFATGHVIVRHNIQAANDLEATFGDEFAKGGGFLRVAFEERFEISDLVERE